MGPAERSDGSMILHVIYHLVRTLDRGALWVEHFWPNIGLQFCVHLQWTLSGKMFNICGQSILSVSSYVSPQMLFIIFEVLWLRCVTLLFAVYIFGTYRG